MMSESSVSPVSSDASSELSNSSRDQNLSLIASWTNDDYDRRELLFYCNQEDALSFTSAFPRSQYSNIHRFDNGTYSEVFRARHKASDCTVILKTIRCVTAECLNIYKVAERGSEIFRDCFRELIITNALSDLRKRDRSVYCPSFTELIDFKLVEGGFPSYFIRESDQDKDISPVKKDPYRYYPGAQIEHMVMSMSDGGKPIWKFVHGRNLSAEGALSIMKQVTLALAVAEEAYEFEHRDMHNSNILLLETSDQRLIFRINDKEYHVDSCGLQVMIIDTTFSRLTIDGVVYYKDMNGTLDPEDYEKADKLTLQDQAYRQMIVATKRDWKPFTAVTNIYWIYYLYRTVQASSSAMDSTNMVVKQEMDFLVEHVPKCKSAREAVHLLTNIPN